MPPFYSVRGVFMRVFSVFSSFFLMFLFGCDSATAGGSTLAVFSAPVATTRTACSYEPITFNVGNNSRIRQTLTISTTGSAQLYSDSQCQVPVTEFSISPNGGNKEKRSVYVLDSVAETITVKGAIQGASASTAFSVRHAVNLLEEGANGLDVADDSAAFTSAVTAASVSLTKDYPNGPAQNAAGLSLPQSILYVPAGNYYLGKIFLKSNVRIEVDANATFRFGADPTATCQTVFFFDSANSSKALASVELPITNVSLVGVGISSVARISDAGWDTSHSFTIDSDPSHQICKWKADGNGVPFTAGVLPPFSIVRNVTGFLIENVLSYQTYSGYPMTGPGGMPAGFPTNVFVFQSGVAGNFTLIKGAGGTTQYAAAVQTPVSEFTHPRWGVYRNHYNLNAPGGYGPAQFQSGENLSVESIYSKGGVALRLETDVAGNGLDPQVNASSPCKDYTGKGKDYRCYAWGSKLDQFHASKIKCFAGNAGVYLSAHGQINGAVDIQDLTTENCYVGVTEEANNLDVSVSSDPHLLSGQFIPTFGGKFEIMGSQVDELDQCSVGGCLAQHPCSTANTFVPNVMANYATHISDSAPWGVLPVGLTQTEYFSNGSRESCPKP